MALAPSLPLSLLLLLLLCGGVVLGDLIITTPQELIDFSTKVNSGKSRSGETVYLGADLDFTPELSSQFVPIGTNTNYFFQGTFDGRGHTISNLAINVSSNFTGLFGISYGIIIKNIVMDSSCSVVNTYSNSDTIATGSIIAYLITNKQQCNIEGIVNIANVTFSGALSGNNYYTHVGGIIGRFYTQNYESFVKNCINYGSLTVNNNNPNSVLGGIVGGSHASNSYYMNIQNCLNYGAITTSGTTTTELRVGGIIGWTYKVYINSCVSGGGISLSNTPSDLQNGAVVGGIYGPTYIYYTYFTSDVGLDSLYGTIESDGSLKKEWVSTTPESIDSTILSKLNTQATSNGWNRWILNTNSNKVTFKVNNNKVFSFSSQVILLPNLNDTESNPFSGWFIDSACTKSFTSQEVSSTTTLYGQYGIMVSVTLNGNGGTPSQQTKYVLSIVAYGSFPTVMREGYSLIGWFTEKGDGKGNVITENTILSTENDHTLYAHWVINNYTLTFIFNNSESDEVRILNYSEVIEYPKDPVREGYSFNGWDNEDITTMPAHNLIVTAQWIINNYTLTFIFNNRTKPEVRVLDYNEAIEYPDDIIRKGYTFNGWLNYTISMPAHNFIVTAQWTPNNYTITFNATGGIVSRYEKNVTYDGVYGELPEAVKEGYSFAGWFTEDDGNGMEITEDNKVEIDDDHTLYAHWSINNYTLTFVFGNGKSDEVRILNYSDPIVGYPNDPIREGYSFNGWDNEGITTMPAHNLNITAQWIKTKETTSSEFVEIVFGKKGLSEEEVKEIIKAYTKEEFVIEEFKVNEMTEEIRVVIRFVNNSEAAAEFVRNVNKSTGPEYIIRSVRVKEDFKSFTSVLYPLLLSSLFIF